MVGIGGLHLVVLADHGGEGGGGRTIGVGSGGGSEDGGRIGGIAIDRFALRNGRASRFFGSSGHGLTLGNSELEGNETLSAPGIRRQFDAHSDDDGTSRPPGRLPIDDLSFSLNAMSETSNLLMIGIDAGDLEFIQAHRTSLPAMGALLDRGRVWRPEATLSLFGSTWPSFVAGAGPGEHGIYQHLAWDAERMGLRLIGGEMRPRRAFWQELEARGLRVVAIDVPYTEPAYLKRGLEITDFATHGATFGLQTNRPGLAREIRARFGRGTMGRETPVRKSAVKLLSIREDMIESAQLKTEMLLHFMAAEPWDVFMAVYGECHRGGHLLWNREDPADLLRVYEAVDAGIGRLVAAAPAETRVFIFSAHGMGEIASQGHLIRPLMARVNEVFLTREEGLGSGADGENGCHGKNGNAGTNGTNGKHERKSAGGFVSWLRERVPDAWQQAAGDAAPEWFRHWVVEREVLGGIDWARTPGFGLRTELRTELRLNLRGREAAGVLECDGPRREAYVDFLRETLMSLKDAATGAPLVERMADVHAEYPGTRVDWLPDYSIQWRDVPPAARAFSESIGYVEGITPQTRGGDHADLGFALLAGDAFDAVDDLPPLERVDQFAAFIVELAGAGRHEPKLAHHG